MGTPEPLDRAITVIRKLLFELATEVDLQYEIEDAHAITPTLVTIKEGRDFLVSVDARVPKVVADLFDRFGEPPTPGE